MSEGQARHTPRRTVRVPEDVWRAAQALVTRDGRPYSPLAKHGISTTGYTYYGCRCTPCTDLKARSVAG